MSGYAPSATFTLAETAAQLSRESGAGTVHTGAIVTSGIFYDPDPDTFGRWKRLGHLGVEMEAAMMYTIAAVKGIETLAIMTVSDILGDDGSTVRISDEDLQGRGRPNDADWLPRRCQLGNSSESSRWAALPGDPVRRDARRSTRERQSLLVSVRS